MKKEDKEILNDLVVEEATKLKKKALKRELKNLDFNYLDLESKFNCIYGQMTGNCFSPRATNLIKSCAKRVFHHNHNIAIKNSKLNGSPKKLSRLDFFSPIEVFIDQRINQRNGNNKLLIDFLQGNADELKFK